MSLRWLAAAFLLSLAVPLLEAELGRELAHGSLAALALLPWLALATVPRAQPAAQPAGQATRLAGLGALRETLFAACLVFPSLALGAGLDLARGAEPRGLGLLCVGGGLALALWSGAAAAAARTPRAQRAYSALWLPLVPGAAALRLALAWASERGSAEAAPAPLYALDPLVWCHRLARADGLAAARAGELGLCVGAALLVLLVVLALARPAGPAAAGARP